MWIGAGLLASALAAALAGVHTSRAAAAETARASLAPVVTACARAAMEPASPWEP